MTQRHILFLKPHIFFPSFDPREKDNESASRKGQARQSGDHTARGESKVVDHAAGSSPCS